MKSLKKSLLVTALLLTTVGVNALDITNATIVYDKRDDALVGKMATVLADDMQRVSGIRPAITTSTSSAKGVQIILATKKCSSKHREIHGSYERYAIDSEAHSVTIIGSDPRGLAYGVFHVSEAIGVSPWYWFADVPVERKERIDYSESIVSKQPTIRYRGIFINDEDWGMKTWAANNFEKELGDIGPKTYDRVCELLLRLRGNMLAPAMHSCTGAFYSHPESQQKAAEWGIMITTSHCEPLLFNNAAKSEWDKERDGEWNYETNSSTILRKLDDRIRETAGYDNIYTMGMRGLHDEAMKGSTDNGDRARTLEKVFAKQRSILTKYKKRKAEKIPQIFVPYKETLDIYDAGLRVPDDITIVWPDDNYGYMKRVSNAQERKRSGRSGVYYHLSYLGTPHDNLWIPTTAPVLMYEELKKAYDAGADRYWLLNVGDIKPMEVEMTHFMDMAYDFPAFTYQNANTYQAQWLSRIFGKEHEQAFQAILDSYYRLAWDRKPEFMGYEIQWDTPDNERLHDTDFSFATGTAQRRLSDYDELCRAYTLIYNKVSTELRPSLFEMLGYALLSSNQMNRKFLYAQRNHETGKALYAELATAANDSINALITQYNTMLDGKWNQMMSCVPPGFVSQYQNMPEFSTKPTDDYKLPEEQLHTEYLRKVDLTSLNIQPPFRLLHGIGTDWDALQMGEPMDLEAKGTIDIPLTGIEGQDSVRLCISVLPMWPVASDKSNAITLSVDDGTPRSFRNDFEEWSKEWKIQVLENRKEFTITLPLNKGSNAHTLHLTISDPGQIIQKITYE